MRIDVSTSLIAAGGRNEPIGTHTSKTMMLAELRSLLAAVPGPRRYSEYLEAATDDNVLQKSTSTTRAKTLSMMRQLYGLDGSIPIFAVLRTLWPIDQEARPMLALLLATARDPLLRATADLILDLAPGDPIGPAEIAAEVGRSFPHRYTPGVLHHIGQNAGATWVQAGVLAGRLKKHRTRPKVTMPAVAYALYLGHCERLAGPALFGSLWSRLFDFAEGGLRSFAEAASRSGWLDYASAGGMTEISFRHLDGLGGSEAA